jgi:hypothetical protein
MEKKKLVFNIYSGQRWKTIWETMYKSVQLTELTSNKRNVKKYWWLPPMEAESIPWNKMCLDLIGPQKIHRKGNKDLIFKFFTMINLANCMVWNPPIWWKNSITVAYKMEQEWFPRYTWQTQIIYDRNSEFIGKQFQSLIKMIMEYKENQ